jgi:hypothetical protein
MKYKKIIEKYSTIFKVICLQNTKQQLGGYRPRLYLGSMTTNNEQQSLEFEI